VVARTAAGRLRLTLPPTHHLETPVPVATATSPPTSARPRVQPWLATVARLGLGGFVLAAGLAKVGDLPASVRAVRAYELLPESLAVLVGNTLPLVEIILGVLLILGLFTRWAAAAAGLLLVVFVLGIASAWARGLSIDCGCFGGGGAIDPEDTRYLEEILRDLALLAVAVFLVRRPRSRLSLDSTFDLNL